MKYSNDFFSVTLAANVTRSQSYTAHLEHIQDFNLEELQDDIITAEVLISKEYILNNVESMPRTEVVLKAKWGSI